MKKLFCVLAVSLMIFAGCKENSNPISFLDVSVEGSFANYEETKAELIPTLKLSWQGGEKVLVFGGKEYLGFLTPNSESVGKSTAILSGTIKAPATGINQLSLVYGTALSAGEYEVGTSYDQVPISFEEQTDTKPSCAVYGQIAYTEGATQITDITFAFSFAATAIRVNCYNLIPSLAIERASISNIATHAILLLANNTISIGQSENGVISRLGSGVSAANNQGEQTVWFGVPKSLKSTQQRVLTIYQTGYIGTDPTFANNAVGVTSSINILCGLEMVPAHSGGIDPYQHIDWTW